jgi:hypothetical protein
MSAVSDQIDAPWRRGASPPSKARRKTGVLPDALWRGGSVRNCLIQRGRPKARAELAMMVQHDRKPVERAFWEDRGYEWSAIGLAGRRLGPCNRARAKRLHGQAGRLLSPLYLGPVR